VNDGAADPSGVGVAVGSGSVGDAVDTGDVAGDEVGATLAVDAAVVGVVDAATTTSRDALGDEADRAAVPSVVAN
jgi:hypothetical protein